MTFINDIYAFNLKFFINKESNPSNHILGTIKYVGENLCKDFIEVNLDQELKTFHQNIRNSHFSLILSQNQTLYDFNEKIKESMRKNGKYHENDTEFIVEILSKLTKIINQPNQNALKASNNRCFQEISPKKRSRVLKEETLRTPTVTSIHLYIHEISLLINDIIKVRILYSDSIIEKNVNSGKNIDIYEI